MTAQPSSSRRGRPEFRQVIYGLHAATNNLFRRVATIESIAAVVSTVATRRENLFHRMQAINDLPKLKCRYAAEQLQRRLIFRS